MRTRLPAALALVTILCLGSLSGAAGAKDKPPTTGFEDSGGAEWTTHEQELEFLDAVDEMSSRVDIDVIGETVQGKPLHLVKLGHPAPASPKQAAKGQTILFVCTQHGNEPAGREACLKLLRDLAFTKDKSLVDQLSTQTILFVPTANPDGRAANTRGNSEGIDINRDHLNLETNEARAVAAVVRDWKPDMVMDLHEYGPSTPVVYDDEILYLWPRNLNVDQEVHDLAHSLANDYVEPQAEEAGYTADEYGQYEIADQDIHQTAGDHDEGIARNAMGLRHSLGVLIETAVTMDPRNGPGEVTTEAEVNLRRVASHSLVADIALGFMRERGGRVEDATEGAILRKIAEGAKGSAPVYFGGADNDEPEEAEIQDPPPCGYELSASQYKDVSGTLKLLGVRAVKRGKSFFISMAQAGEPLIPLLLDERGARHAVEGKALERC